MDAEAYQWLWMLVLLAGLAGLSAAISRHKHRHDGRRHQADRLLQLLHGYGEWVTAQRLVTLFGDEAGVAPLLAEATRLRAASFPELARPMADLLLVHRQLLDFFAAQQALWQRDPDRWIASDHDRRFMTLWRHHHAALHALQQPLRQQLAARRSTALGRRQSRFA